jgi:hypothetical protein
VTYTEHSEESDSSSVASAARQDLDDDGLVILGPVNPERPPGTQDRPWPSGASPPFGPPSTPPSAVFSRRARLHGRGLCSRWHRALEGWWGKVGWGGDCTCRRVTVIESPCMKPPVPIVRAHEGRTVNLRCKQLMLSHAAHSSRVSVCSCAAAWLVCSRAALRACWMGTPAGRSAG